MEQKIKYINLWKQDQEIAIITFLCEFEDKYLSLDELNKLKGKNRRNRNPLRQARVLLKMWTSKYNQFGSVGLISMTGKLKGKNIVRPKLSEQTKHDIDLYDEMVHELLKNKGVTKKEIQDLFKEKREKGKQMDSHKSLTQIFGVNRTSVHSKYNKVIRNESTALERLYDEQLIVQMKEIISESDNTIGRDKLMMIINENRAKTDCDKISSYKFRVNFVSLNYRSKAYIRNWNRPPSEEKYRGIYCEDNINGDFKTSIPNEKWFADISYIKISNMWYYFHIIIDSHNNEIIDWTLSRDRTALATINLLKQAIAKSGCSPKIFHTDHGTEYANQYVTQFLSDNGIEQSMSPKGCALRNRPSEYFFSLMKREKIYLYNISKMNVSDVMRLIGDYIQWYHYGRVQSCLKYKTPFVFKQMVSINQCV